MSAPGAVSSATSLAVSPVLSLDGSLAASSVAPSRVAGMPCPAWHLAVAAGSDIYCRKAVGS
jgi:hypothetical protein